MAIEWKFVGENSADSGALAEQHLEEDKQAEEISTFNKGVAEITGRHLARQANRAAELNAVPAPELPQGFTPGTGQSVALEQPLPPRNPAPGGLLPLSVPGSKEARGYVDAQGNVTEAGKQFFNLYKEGIFDDDGILTDKGRAFLMDKDSANEPENLQAFIERDKAGLNREDPQSWGKILGGLVGTLKDAAVASDRLVQRTGLDLFYSPKAWVRGDRTAVQEAEDLLTAMTFAEGSVENTAGLGSGMFRSAQRFNAWLNGADEDAYRAKQAHSRFKAEMEDAELAQYVGGLFGSAELMKNIELTQGYAEKTLGPERAAQIEKEGQASGAIVGDPINLATMGVGSAIGAMNKGEKLLAAGAAVDRALVARTTAAKLAEDLALTKAATARTEAAAAIAAQRSADLKGIGQLERAKRLEDTAKRLTLKTTEAKQALPTLEAKATDQAAIAAKLTEQAGGAERLLQQAQVGRQLRKLPAEVAGKAMEDVGDWLVRKNEDVAGFVERHGLDKLGTVAGAGIGLVTGGLPGMLTGAAGGFGLGKLGGINLAKASMAGPFLKQMGGFTRAMGQESMQHRGSVPFWQRVANTAELNPVAQATAHLADMASLGGRVAIPARALAKGVAGGAAAAPMNLVFETVGEGGDLSPNGLKRAVASSFVFGGGPAALGGLVQGTLQARTQKAVGNELNFRNALGNADKGVFSSLKPGARRVVSEYAAAFPDLGWKFTQGTRSFYDPRANTIVLGTNTNRILEAVAAHEISHRISVDGQMEAGITAALVGSDGTGGLLRSKDGMLDLEFKAFMDAYNADAAAAGMPTLDVEQAAIEYFTDSTVQDVLGMAQGGELQRFAGRSAGTRAMDALSRATVGRLPLLKDLFYRTGGATDARGDLVKGTGILADGIREIPAAREMFRRYLRENAGRRGGGAVKDPDKAAEIPIDLAAKSKPLMDAMFSTFETDAAGNVVYDKEGVPRYIPREVIKKRETAGKIITHAVEEKIAAGEIPPEGELRPTPEGKWEGQYLPADAIKRLEESGVFNARQLANLRMYNNAAKRGKGELFAVIYQPATIKRPGKRAAYGSLAPTFRDVAPVAVSVSNQGNILLHLFSATQFDRNVGKRASSDLGKRLYQGNANEIKADAYAMMEAHKTRGDSFPHFVEKYGADKARNYQNFINSIFVTDTKAQRAINPLFDSEKINGPKESVYKTYRLDRLNQITRLQGVPMPYNHAMMRDRNLPPGFRPNLFPNGLVEPVPAPKRAPQLQLAR